MALSTYETIWRKVLLRCPLAGPMLARDWVSNAFRQVAERRRWSFLIKKSQFLTYNVYSTGKVAVTFGSNLVTGSGTAFTSAMVNRQFRTGTTAPLYTITAIDVGAQVLTLEDVYGSDSSASIGYEIYNAYVTAPSDFHSFVSVYDPKMNWQLWTHVQQEELNAMDAQRSNNGQSYVVADYSYDDSVSPPLPRYELWPHQKGQYVYPFLYERRPPDLEDSGASLPRFIRGDLLLEMALADAAKWPGPSQEKINPYFNLGLSREHASKAEYMIAEAERQDDEVMMQDVTFQRVTSMPMAVPWGDSKWLQSHAIGM